MNKDIPVISLQRLPIYLNYLKSLPEDRTYVSSGLIAEALGMGEVLVRKDLAYTSATGRPRVGYVAKELISALEDFLCCNGRRSAVIAGVGALGRAVLSYGGFANYGIEIVAAFDSDVAKSELPSQVNPYSIFSTLKGKCAVSKRNLRSSAFLRSMRRRFPTCLSKAA